MRIAMRTASGIAALVLCASCGRSTSGVEGSPSTAETRPADPSQAAAVVTDTEATITIPVGRRPVWRWNLNATPAGYREYQWEVAGVDSRAVGFSLFKSPRSRPSEGNLSDLLAAGQSSMWEGTPDGGGRLVGAVRVKPAERDSAVEIVVVEQSILERLKATRPAILNVVTKTPDAGEHRYSVAVTYKGR